MRLHLWLRKTSAAVFSLGLHMKSLHVNGLLLLILAVPGTVGSLLFSSSTAAQMTPYGAQEMPPANNNAARVQITEGPTLEIVQER